MPRAGRASSHRPRPGGLGQDYIEYDDPVIAKAVTDAADATFREGICDLDWTAATLRHLGYAGPTL